MRNIIFFLILLSGRMTAQSNYYQKKYTRFIASNCNDYATINDFFKSDKNDTIKLVYAFEKSKQLKSENTQACLANNIGIFYRDISNYEKSLKYHNQALILSKKTKNSLIEITSYNMLGVVYRRIDEINLAIENHQKALQINEEQIKKSDDLLMCKAVSLNSLGNIYLTLNQYDLALQNFHKTLFIEKTRNNKKGIAINYQNIGGVYENQNKLNLALENYKKSLEYNHDDIGIVICNNNIGVILLKQGNAKKAFSLIYPTIAISNKLKDDYYTSNAYINLGWSYLALGNFYKAKSNIEIGLKIASIKKYPSYQAAAFKLLAEIAEKQNQFKLSNYYLKNYYLITEELSGAKTQKNLFDYILKYENQKKETAIKLKDREIKINSLTLESNKKQKLFFTSGLFLLAIIGGLLFYQSRKRKQVNQKLQVLNNDLDQANKVKVRFFGILNHDLRSPVNNLIHYLHLQKESPELLDEATKTQIESETMTSAENLLSSMEDMLLWSKGQMENFKPQPKKVSVNQLFDDTKKVFSGYLHIKFEYQNPENIELFTDENYLKTIIRNLTSNAINVFTSIENPNIIWKAWQEPVRNGGNGKSFLSITDNGKGAENHRFKALYDDNEVIGIQSGLGLHLIRDLAKAINCEIAVDSKVGIGTTFILKLQN